jgi:hypothetical protein
MLSWIIFPPTTRLGWCVVVAEIALAAGMPVVLTWVALAVRSGSKAAAGASLLAALVAAFVLLQPAIRTEHVGFDAFDCLFVGIASGFALGSAVGLTLAVVKTRSARFTAVVALCDTGLAGGVVALSALCRIVCP